MTFGGSALGAFVAAASVTKLFQFGGRFLWSEEVLEPSVGVSEALVALPLAGAAPGLRYCLASEAEPEPVECVLPEAGFLEDPGEQRALFGSNAITLMIGGLLSSCVGCRRWFLWSTPVVAQHGRGAFLRDQRTRGRGRLQIAGAGALGIALV